MLRPGAFFSRVGKKNLREARHFFEVFAYPRFFPILEPYLPTLEPYLPTLNPYLRPKSISLSVLLIINERIVIFTKTKKPKLKN